MKLKYLMIMLLCMAAFCVKGQQVCKDTIFKVPYTYSFYERDTTITTEKIFIGYKWIYGTACGKLCQMGLRPPHPKVLGREAQYRDTIIYTYDSTLVTVTTTIDSIGEICHEPPPLPRFKQAGVWGNGDNVSQKKVDQLISLIQGNGWRPRFDMATFWPQEGVFNKKYITDQLDVLRANKLVAGVMIFTGDNMPQWQFLPIGTATSLDGKFQSVKTDRGIYPYYEDLNYEINVKKGWTEFFKILSEYKDVVSYFIPTVGSTGDVGDKGGYKGNPDNPKYDITREWWTAFTKKMWLWAHDNCPTNIGLNPGNDGQYLEWASENLPKCTDMKQGNFTHEYDKPNDKLQWQRMQQYPQYKYFGEMEGDAPTSQNGVTTIVFQCAYVGMNVINVAPDKAIYSGLEFANTYFGTDNQFWYAHSRKGTANDITEPYARGFELTGGTISLNDNVPSSSMFGLYYWNGSGTIKISRPVSTVRIWYKDGTGTVQIGSKLVRGTGSNRQTYVDFEYSGATQTINSSLNIYLIEGK